MRRSGICRRTSTASAAARTWRCRKSRPTWTSTVARRRRSASPRSRQPSPWPARRAADLQRQLASQEAGRQAQSAELERLRQQVEENRQAMQSRIETDRQARIAAERRLDEAMAKYEAAVASGNAPDVDTLRRQVED